jgi:transcription elongation factor Elf1
MLACPFCSEEKLLEIGTMSKDREGTPIYIWCAYCGAQGPWKYVKLNEQEQIDVEYVASITGWNKRG